MPAAWSTSARLRRHIRQCIVEHPRRASSLSPLQGSWPGDSRARRAHRKGQIWIKRTILEMGGKDTILVCADANLDAAADGVVASLTASAGKNVRPAPEPSLTARFMTPSSRSCASEWRN